MPTPGPGVEVGRGRLEGGVDRVVLAREVDPLMGWTSSTDMNGQVRLNFDSKEEAVEYAERHGIADRGIREGILRSLMARADAR